jgi:hypothetical protein
MSSPQAAAVRRQGGHGQDFVSWDNLSFVKGADCGDRCYADA